MVVTMDLEVQMWVVVVDSLGNSQATRRLLAAEVVDGVDRDRLHLMEMVCCVSSHSGCGNGANHSA